MKTLTKKDLSLGVCDHSLVRVDAGLVLRPEAASLEQFSHRLINAHDEERQNIARQLHDDFGNRIALIALSLSQIMMQQSANSGPSTKVFQNMFEQVTDLAAAVRCLSHSLHPPLLRYVGMIASLKSLQERFEKAQGIHVNLVTDVGLPQLEDDMALCIFRVTEEALNNVARHSGAARADVVLERAPSGIRLTVSDAGSGFMPSEPETYGRGLRTMASRARSVGGHFIVNSTLGLGTQICLEIPL